MAVLPLAPPHRSRNWTCLSVLALPAAKASLAPAPAPPPNHLATAMATAAGTPSGSGAPLRGPGGPVVSVPPALCCAVTHNAVVAGFGDGEARVWHCGEEFKMAALRIAAAEFGLPGATPRGAGAVALPTAPVPAVAAPISAAGGLQVWVCGG